MLIDLLVPRKLYDVPSVLLLIPWKIASWQMRTCSGWELTQVPSYAFSLLQNDQVSEWFDFCCSRFDFPFGLHSTTRFALDLMSADDGRNFHSKFTQYTGLRWRWVGWLLAVGFVFAGWACVCFTACAHFVSRCCWGGKCCDFVCVCENMIGGPSADHRRWSLKPAMVSISQSTWCCHVLSVSWIVSTRACREVVKSKEKELVLFYSFSCCWSGCEATAGVTWLVCVVLCVPRPAFFASSSSKLMCTCFTVYSLEVYFCFVSVNKRTWYKGSLVHCQWIAPTQSTHLNVQWSLFETHKHR